MRDHIVSASDNGDCGDQQSDSAETRLLTDLLLHRDAVCVLHTQPPEG